MKLKKLTAAIMTVGLATGMTGCFSSNDSGPRTVVYDGVVETDDGQVFGATVCLDENGSLTCDADEPFDTSNGVGEFSITTLETDANLVAESADVEGVTGVVSAFSHGVGPLFLTAPNTASVVSPLTTLVTVRTSLTGRSFEDVSQELTSLLGLPQGVALTDLRVQDLNATAVAFINTVQALISTNLSIIVSSAPGSSSATINALAIDDLFRTDANGQSRLQVIAAAINAAVDAGQQPISVISSLVQQNAINPEDVQSGVERVEGLLNAPTPTPTPEPTPDPSGGSGGVIAPGFD